MTPRQDLVVAPIVALHRAHVANAAMTVLMVVPMYELARPLRRGVVS
jgi:hypothetical protein